jgi:hypothetical protein
LKKEKESQLLQAFSLCFLLAMMIETSETMYQNKSYILS